MKCDICGEKGVILGGKITEETTGEGLGEDNRKMWYPCLVCMSEFKKWRLKRERNAEE